MFNLDKLQNLNEKKKLSIPGASASFNTCSPNTFTARTIRSIACAR